MLVFGNVLSEVPAVLCVKLQANFYSKNLNGLRSQMGKCC